MRTNAKQRKLQTKNGGLRERLVCRTPFGAGIKLKTIEITAALLKLVDQRICQQQVDQTEGEVRYHVDQSAPAIDSQTGGHALNCSTKHGEFQLNHLFATFCDCTKLVILPWSSA